MIILKKSQIIEVSRNHTSKILYSVIDRGGFIT